ncbi:MAG: chain length determinant protein tyrosine kinase EpsG [Nitrosomonadales bacterium]|nr:chain length determinant protein tyrosine kinase EpsG [Nitrosomonadales bacterium]
MNISHINPIPVSSEIRRPLMLGQILQGLGKLSDEQLESILAMQRSAGLSFGAAAKSLNLVTDADIQKAWAIQFDYCYLPTTEETFSRRLVAAYEPFSPQVEALRALRSQLVLQWFNHGNRMLSIVSPNPKEGCSELAANLAVVFSQMGERTLLIDANLRSPDQQIIFNLSQPRGLSDILIGRNDLSIATKMDSLSGLYVLGAGTLPPNPQELLSRRGFGELLIKAQEQFDVVIVDTPPAVLSSDAQTVAARCGGALLVSNVNKTRMADIINVRDQLQVCGVQIVAAIVKEQ